MLLLCLSSRGFVLQWYRLRFGHFFNYIFKIILIFFIRNILFSVLSEFYLGLLINLLISLFTFWFFIFLLMVSWVIMVRFVLIFFFACFYLIVFLMMLGFRFLIKILLRGPSWLIYICFRSRHIALLLMRFDFIELSSWCPFWIRTLILYL